jgi:hypothetical protein
LRMEIHRQYCASAGEQHGQGVLCARTWPRPRPRFWPRPRPRLRLYDNDDDTSACSDRKIQAYPQIQLTSMNSACLAWAVPLIGLFPLPGLFCSVIFTSVERPRKASDERSAGCHVIAGQRWTQGRNTSGGLMVEVYALLRRAVTVSTRP